MSTKEIILIGIWCFQGILVVLFILNRRALHRNLREIEEAQEQLAFYQEQIRRFEGQRENAHLS